MATDVVMPQMGESVAEGTIVRWIKKVGDTVDRDEPLFEISTDKVDAEIPSPAAGVVTQIRVKEGETVPVNSVVAVIDAAGSKPATPPAFAPPSSTGATAGKPASAHSASPAPPAAPAHDEESHQRLSPVVRKIAKEHNVDVSKIQGTGIGGRVTRDDILAFIEGKVPSRPATPAGSAPTTKAPAPEGPKFKPGADTEIAPMSVMRKKIAEHMVMSRKTSAHVHSVFEVNFGRVAQIREKKKAEYERAGAKLTYLSFIMKVVVDALRAVPVANASLDGDNVVYHKHVNLGVAVALDWGLIVPVIKNAEDLDLLGLSKRVADLAARARSKHLKPEEVSGGTFTITNPGVFGALFGMPIINQPQVAILGVGSVEKRPVVIDDAIAIRPMAYLTLGYDHRIIDGAVADEFMSHLKHAIENWDPNAA